MLLYQIKYIKLIEFLLRKKIFHKVNVGLHVDLRISVNPIILSSKFRKLFLKVFFLTLFTSSLIERYRCYLPVTPAPNCDFFLCPFGHKRHLIPVAGTLERMEEHLRKGHGVINLMSEGLQPEEVKAGELNVPYVEIVQLNSKSAVINQKMRHECRPKAAGFLKFAMQHSDAYSRGRHDVWMTIDDVDRQDRMNLFRGASVEEKKSIYQKF
jgi:hypothetical protein